MRTAGSSRSRRAAAGCRRSSPAIPASACRSACRASCSIPPSIRTTCSRPGKRPRATLSPSMALRDGQPFLSFAVQGGDAQDQNLLQFFLNMVEFKMRRAASRRSRQRQQLSDAEFVRRPHRPSRAASSCATTRRRGCKPSSRAWAIASKAGSAPRGPINAIFIDRANGSLWGGSSDFGEDYGIAW